MKLWRRCSVLLERMELSPKYWMLREFRTGYSTDTMSSPSTPTTEPYSIQKVTPKDTERVLDHLRRFFFRDEPLNISVKLLEGGNGTCLELEEFSMKSINDGCSLMAVSDSGKIVGVSLNGIDKREYQPEDEDCPNEKFDKILKLLAHVDAEADVFGKYPDVDRVMNVKVLSVDSTWRGRGIAKQLLDRTRDIARDRCYGLMRVDCSSHFSARAIAKLGFECIYLLKYADYKVNGEVVFKPEHPHNEMMVYIQRIN